ncbi:MAG: hypothetical protein RL410_276 [Actinomycetota bacterium]|jgi:putative endonuclease
MCVSSKALGAHYLRMTSALKDSVGLWGEEYAARFLVARGFTLLARNLRTDLAEVDVLLRDMNTLVLCEVKTRTSSRAGIAGEAIDVHRIQRLRNTAELLVVNYPECSSARVDAVLVDVKDCEISLQHIRGLE